MPALHIKKTYPSTKIRQRELRQLQEKFYPSPAMKIKLADWAEQTKLPKSHLPIFLLENFFREYEQTGTMPATLVLDETIFQDIKDNKYL